MAEYIIKDAALKALCQVSAPTPSESYIVEKCIEKIIRLPMMEVVRCKECKHRETLWGEVYCGFFDASVVDDGFCNFGERRADV